MPLVRDLLSSVIALLLVGACTRTPPSQAPVQPDASTAPAPTPASATPQVPGPVAGTRLTEAYERAAARDVCFWAWTLVNDFQGLSGPGRLGGVLPAAPPNTLSMLTDYVAPSQREVACPNQDVVYGGGPLALDVEPVVIQVPDFGHSFWVSIRRNAPSPKGKPFSQYVRTYWPDAAILDGTWSPPTVEPTQ